MRQKKRFSLFLTLLVLAAAFCGCASKKEKPAQTVGTTAPVSTATDPRETLDPVTESIMEKWDAPEPATDKLQWNPYSKNDFDYEGDYLTCLSGESMLGIDVSSYQGDIDWEQVASAGVEFVMLRLGSRGSTEGGLYQDSLARNNYLMAHAAGLRVGGYFFSQATTPEEAEEEAELALSILEDWEVEMPIVYDWEYLGADARTGDMDAGQVTACAIAFCERIREAGYTPMVYFNIEQGWLKMDLEELAGYELWLAWYDSPMLYPYKLNMWQYTDSGSVPGISGNVDMNLYLIYGEA